jgi:hypothetical protein
MRGAKSLCQSHCTRPLRTFALSVDPLRSILTLAGTGMGLEPIRDSLATTRSAPLLRQPLLKAAARIFVFGWWLPLPARCAIQSEWPSKRNQSNQSNLSN